MQKRQLHVGNKKESDCVNENRIHLKRTSVKNEHAAMW